MGLKQRMGWIVALAGLLGACTVVPAARPYPVHGTVYVAPPPVVGRIWINGRWYDDRHRHEGGHGHWEAPRPVQRWAPPRWERRGHHGHHHGGPWDDDRPGRGR